MVDFTFQIVDVNFSAENNINIGLLYFLQFIIKQAMDEHLKHTTTKNNHARKEGHSTILLRPENASTRTMQWC